MDNYHSQKNPNDHDDRMKLILGKDSILPTTTCSISIQHHQRLNVVKQQKKMDLIGSKLIQKRWKERYNISNSYQNNNDTKNDNNHHHHYSPSSSLVDNINIKSNYVASDTSTRNRNNDNNTGTYRNLSGCSYVSCTFLGPRDDIVVAIDENCCLDVVRFCNTKLDHLYGANMEDDDDDNNSNNNDTRNQHHLHATSFFLKSYPLCTNVSVQNNISTSNNSSNYHQQHQHQYHHGDKCSKIQCVSHTEGLIAIGMESGTFKIVSIDNICNKSGTSNTNQRNDTTTTTTNATTFIIKHLIQNIAPYRRYQRNNQYTLSYQLRTRNNSTSIQKSPFCDRNNYWYDPSNALLAHSEFIEESNPYSMFRSYVDDLEWNSSSNSSSNRSTKNTMFQRCNNSCWDFRTGHDNSNNNIMAAYINRYADAFYLQIIDNRQSQSTKNNLSTAVCVDVDMTGTMILTGICFLSDFVLATSTTTSSSTTATVLPNNHNKSSIKLWDIRFMKNPSNHHKNCNTKDGHVSNFEIGSIRNTENNNISSSPILSYPNDPVYGMESSLSSLSVIATSNKNDKNKINRHQTTFNSQHACRRNRKLQVVLSTSNNNNNYNTSNDTIQYDQTIHTISSFDEHGNILVTFTPNNHNGTTSSCSSSLSPYYAVIDPFQMRVINEPFFDCYNTHHHHQQQYCATDESDANGHSTNSPTYYNHSVHSPQTQQQQQSCYYPITAINKRNGCVAIYNEKVSPNNILMHYPRHGGGGSGCLSSNNGSYNRKRKTTHNSRDSVTDNTTTNNNTDDNNSSSTATTTFLHVPIKDRYNLQSQLTSFTFNETGTRMAGVSVDGDIFVW